MRVVTPCSHGVMTEMVELVTVGLEWMLIVLPVQLVMGLRELRCVSNCMKAQVKLR